jgi:spermidine/putrescine transport system substrate-binding protein
MAPNARRPLGGMSRRRLLGGAGGVAFAGLSAAVLPLFSTADRHQNPADCKATDTSAQDKHFVISNWPEYIDPDTKHYKSTMTRFEEHYGVSVSYTPDINDNVQFFAKVVNQLGSCSTTKRDMFVLTDWMAARMIEMGWIQPLDPARVPNLHKNILSSLRSPDWDPHRKYSAPWQAGFTGIGYNKKYLPNPPRTIKELLTRPDLKGKISVLTEMRDTMGLIMLSEGIDPAHFNRAQWSRSIEILQRAKSSGQIRAFQGNEYLDDLSAGNIVAAMVWSGDMASSGDNNLKFIVPEEGMMIWSDNMIVPNLSPHLSLAEDWVNWYYDPYQAALLADYNWYVSPVEGAQEQMRRIDPEAVNNPLIFPTAEYLKQTHLFMALREYQIRDYEGDFANVSGV